MPRVRRYRLRLPKVRLRASQRLLRPLKRQFLRPRLLLRLRPRQRLRRMASLQAIRDVLRLAPWLVMLLALACTRGDRPQVTGVHLEVSEGADVLGLETPAVNALALEQLKATRLVRVEEGKTPSESAVQLKVHILVGAQEPDVTQAGEGHVRVRFTVKPKGQEAFMVDVSVREKASTDSVEGIQTAARSALNQALQQAWLESEALLTLRAKTDTELTAALKTGSAAEQNAVVRLLVERHNSAATPVLLARLKGTEARSMGPTMGLLVELGDPKAVLPLIELGRGQSLQVQRAIIFAVGAIGGDDAEGYLSAVSQGHDDEILKAAAQQSLDELGARKAREKKP